MKVKPVNLAGIRITSQKELIEARRALQPLAVLATLQRGPKDTKAVARALLRFEHRLARECRGMTRTTRARCGRPAGPWVLSDAATTYAWALRRLSDLSSGENPKITRKDGLWTAL